VPPGLTGTACPWLVQVCVNNAGTVNITNITVDGNGGGGATAITYNNTSGTMNHIETRFQEGEGRGVGIAVPGENGKAYTVTVENSNLHSFDFIGIWMTALNTSMKIEGNTIAPDADAQLAIETLYPNSLTISGNFVNGPSAPAGCNPTDGYVCGGIVVEPGSAGSITNNTVAGVGGGYPGILFFGGFPTTMSVTSNTIFNISGDGIQINPNLNGVVSPLTIKENVITQAQNGINFDCNLDNNVSSNTITAMSSYGVANVASGENSPNTYYNVPTLYSTCP